MNPIDLIIPLSTHLENMLRDYRKSQSDEYLMACHSMLETAFNGLSQALELYSSYRNTYWAEVFDSSLLDTYREAHAIVWTVNR